MNFVICAAVPPATGWRQRLEMPRRVSIYSRLLPSGDHCAGTGTVFINPLFVSEDRVVPADALVVLRESGPTKKGLS